MQAISSSHYDILERCGSGGSGTVYRARCKSSKDEVAIKCLAMDGPCYELDRLANEAVTMRMLRHPNILPLDSSFVEGEELWLVTPYCAGGSLSHLLQYSFPQGIPELAVASLIKDLLSALQYIHSRGGVHGDVKAANLLLDGSGKLLLADFGLARATGCCTAASSRRSTKAGRWAEPSVRGAPPSSSNRRMSHSLLRGSPCWMAPELILEGQHRPAVPTLASDIWSLGITALELATGQVPHGQLDSISDVLRAVVKGQPPLLEPGTGCSRAAQALASFASACLQKDPDRRPSAAQLLRHSLITRHAQPHGYVRQQLLSGLAPLTSRLLELHVRDCSSRGLPAGQQDGSIRGGARAQQQQQHRHKAAIEAPVVVQEVTVVDITAGQRRRELLRAASCGLLGKREACRPRLVVHQLAPAAPDDQTPGAASLAAAPTAAVALVVEAGCSTPAAGKDLAAATQGTSTAATARQAPRPAAAAGHLKMQLPGAVHIPEDARMLLRSLTTLPAHLLSQQAAAAAASAPGPGLGSLWGWRSVPLASLSA